jgi:hypothetical protein
MRFDDAIVVAAAHASGEVVPARAPMAGTLGFHIILACLGIALPSFVLLAEFIGLRRRHETALRLARRWSQAMGVLVAVGAVTGTVLSFEMGLLWPGLMRQYGALDEPVRRRHQLGGSGWGRSTRPLPATEIHPRPAWRRR